jgi:hypothetical protein
MERDTIEKRNRALFRHYLNVIKGHGAYARFVPKSQLYEETGAPFYIGNRRVYEIISSMIKNKDSGNLPIETEEELALVLSVYEQ